MTRTDTIDVMVERLWFPLSAPLVYHSLTYWFTQRLGDADGVTHPIFMLLVTRLVIDVPMSYLFIFTPCRLSNLQSHP